MSPIFWVFMAGIGAAGYFGYRKLHSMERELRQEVKEEKEQPEKRTEEIAPEREASENEAGADPLEERLLERVRKQPGLLQTELYELFPEESRRTLQELLRRFDREGRVARTREKGSYRLYPVQ